MAETSHPRPWLQVDVALCADSPDRSTSAYLLFAKIVQIFASAIDSRVVTGWFFQRKPPDIRLRLQLGPETAAAEADRFVGRIDAALAIARDEGHVTGSWWSNYEPETDRFGGPATMAIVHAHFVRDSAWWHDVDRAVRSAPGTPPDELVRRVRAVRVLGSHAVLDAALPDPADRAAAWSRLTMLTTGAPPPTTAPLLTGAELAELAHRARAWLGTAAEGLLGSLDDAAMRLSSDLGATAPIGRPQLLALVTHFDANRWGVDGTHQRWMASTWREVR